MSELTTIIVDTVTARAPSGQHVFGAAADLPGGNTATLITFDAPTNWRLTGLRASGDTDGIFEVLYDDEPAYPLERILLSRPSAEFAVAPDPEASGKTVTVKVTNLSSASGSFRAKLLGVLDE